MDSHEREDLPELGGIRDQQPGEDALTHQARDVGADHHPAPRQPVREDAACQKEQDLRKRPGCRDEAEIGDGARDVEHGERKRERNHPRSEPRDGLAEEEKPELALAEGAERLGQPHGPRLLGARGRVHAPQV